MKYTKMNHIKQHTYMTLLTLKTNITNKEYTEFQ